MGWFKDGANIFTLGMVDTVDLLRKEVKEDVEFLFSDGKSKKKKKKKHNKHRDHFREDY